MGRRRFFLLLSSLNFHRAFDTCRAVLSVRDTQLSRQRSRRLPLTYGLAQWRLPQTFMRGTNFQFRTALSAGLLPPLRQTAS